MVGKKDFWIFDTILPLFYYCPLTLVLIILFIIYKKLWKYTGLDFNIYKFPDNIVSNIFFLLFDHYFLQPSDPLRSQREVVWDFQLSLTSSAGYAKVKENQFRSNHDGLAKIEKPQFTNRIQIGIFFTF